MLDQLDPGQFEAVGRLFEVMAGPVERALSAAPADDEPVTEQDRRRLGDYRVLFNFIGGSMGIFGVRHRSEAYR